MKIGDYVRFNFFRISVPIHISKIIDINYDEQEYINLYGTEDGFILTDSNIIKSSPNILELLEPMDLLYVDISPDDCGGIVVPRIPETLDELERYIEKIKSGEYILKYVVTHEQLENDMYKVGE